MITAPPNPPLALRTNPNKFFDMSYSQLASTYLMTSRPNLSPSGSTTTTSFPTTPVGATSSTPATVNWVTAGYVTPIRDQQQVGTW